MISDSVSKLEDNKKEHEKEQHKKEQEALKDFDDAPPDLERRTTIVATTNPGAYHVEGIAPPDTHRATTLLYSIGPSSLPPPNEDGSINSSSSSSRSASSNNNNHNQYLAKARAINDRHQPSIVYYPADDSFDLRTESEKQRRKQRRLFIIGFITVAIITLGLGLGLGLGFSRRNGDGATTTTTSSPSQSPSSSPTLGNDAIVNFVASVTGTSLDILMNATDSPQFKALEWLQDSQFNPIVTMSSMTIQRYVLAVFYFSTNGNDWVNNRGWLSDRSICTWFSSSPSALEDDDSCTGLQQLDLNRNGLGGTIPSEIGLLGDSLLLLDLSFNVLNGTLPTELGELTKVERFWVEANLLQSPVPTELGQLVSATTLYLNANDFVGTIPNEICTLRQQETLQFFWADCEEIACPCCARCCKDDRPCNMP